MRYHYKKPGDWLWTPYDTSSVAADAENGKVGADWRFRPDGDTQNYSLSEAIQMEAAIRQPRRPATGSVPASSTGGQTYPAVRTLASVYRTLAYVILIIGVLCCIAVLVTTGSFLLCVAIAFSTMLTFIVQLAAGELLGIMPDIADATKESTTLLREIKASLTRDT